MGQPSSLAAGLIRRRFGFNWDSSPPRLSFGDAGVVFLAVLDQRGVAQKPLPLLA